MYFFICDKLFRSEFPQHIKRCYTNLSSCGGSGVNFISFEPGHEKMCLMPYANNKGADQPAHPRSLISAFVVRCQDRMISSLYIRNFKILAGLCI